jgi:hypothetical protein
LRWDFRERAHPGPFKLNWARSFLVQEILFVLAENGNLQDLSRMAEAGRSPLQIALLFDLSGRANNRFEFERQAAT